jgi:acyl-CoA synthetase (AMP-forming)/AMP-acid ligase II
MAGRRLDVEFFDQTDFVPLHEGPNVLPHDLIFHTLQDLAMNHNGTAVKDDSKGHAVSHRQLFSDIIRCRNEVRATLDSKTVKMLQSDCEVSICILSEGYEFVVAFFAVLALGGIAVPLSRCFSQAWSILADAA